MASVKQNIHIINRKNILYDQRYSIARLAKDIGCSAAAVSLAIRGVTVSLKMHRAITKKLGVTLASFWPELYGETENEEAPDNHQNTVQCC